VQVLRQPPEYTRPDLDEVDRQQAFLLRARRPGKFIRQGGGRGKEVEVRVLGDD
jgi:hypothetical protein